MALQDIVDRIRSDAVREAEQIRSQAQERAAEIERSAKEEAQRRRAAIISSAQSRAEEIKRRSETLWNLERRKELLEAKQEMVEKAFELARQSIMDMEQSRYFELMKRLVVSCAGSGEGELVVSARDRQRLGDQFLREVNAQLASMGNQGAIKFAADTKQMCGGFILRTGNVELNASFDAKLRELRDSLEAEVARLLFEEGAQQELRQ
ncbi:MAG: V-type ATP synthase subunit E [Bacillota bacterium]